VADEARDLPQGHGHTGNMAGQSSERARSGAGVEELNYGDGGSGANRKFW
jgi:hypothetical protein